MQKYINSAADATTGAALSGATISVYRTGTAVLATLYADASGTPKANPTVADSNGLYWFYALNGRYDIVISKIGYASVTLSDIELHDETEASDYGMQTTNSDNTGALQAAINAISARVGVNNSGGDVIEIPSGTHNFLGTVTIPNSFIRLIGAGRQSTYLAFCKQNNLLYNWKASPFLKVKWHPWDKPLRKVHKKYNAAYLFHT